MCVCGVAVGVWGGDEALFVQQEAVSAAAAHPSKRRPPCPRPAPLSHRKKRMKQIKKMAQRGLLDPEKEDPFALFVASTNIR